MKVDHVLILAAGKGTRMGKVGEVLPKVLWPIFNKTILELEVEFAKLVAPEANIYTNVFNYKEKILSFIESSSLNRKITPIIEEEKLDIGGAIHNFAREVNYKGNLLILNCDLFLFMKKKQLEESLKFLNNDDVLLFSYDVERKDGYNQLSIEKEYLKGIILNKDVDKDIIQTYTGRSIINLERLKPNQGESKFFDSVANPVYSKVRVEKITDLEYWDFGTLELYRKNIFEILNKENSEMYKFLESVGCKFSNFKVSEKLEFGDFTITSESVSYNGITQDF